ncbi:GDSL-type esterase/lipase family protein [Fibrobacter sp. UWB10]|uniref:GDSL-type esterase/lipase family protein n=1 Tax=Fibrobacter sp. UWB10 TaxID=1896201 RepID=UPI002402EA90|nr:GDSL-type esterase/lipase family protein [Fibrobacter sp. UWB10]SMP43486.1 Lysophospholipase L1 [Fibrobacter sp. UWB10]
MFGKLSIAASLAMAVSSALATTNVACVGNSITEGYGIWADKKYPDHLQEMLGNDYAVTNFGVSSMTFAGEKIKGGDNNSSYWKTDKFKAALASSPNIVIIELGTNDSKYFMESEGANYNYLYGQCEKSQLYADYEALIDTFAHLPTNPEIYATLQPYSNNVGWAIMDTAIVSQINPIIKETAVKKGVNIIDLHTLFQTPAWFLDDSVHPNATGAQELAKIVNKYMTLAKPTLKQEQATLQVSGTNYGIRWYKDGKLIEGADKTTLTLTEKGKYKALVKVENDNDSWLLSNEIEVNDLSGTTGIAPDRNKKAQPKLRKLRHKVDVKGRWVK